ncbi:DUF5708 family protein [Streptomyces sp. NPDC046832]|uniref:DUF5708 family protein n=1 Tax=Streptomyces sp. NPDC046832 TaxID=3155020 RepID=UPI0033ECAECB
MSRARGNLLEGTVTFAAGLGLWLFTGDVEVPLVTLTKVGVVMMCVGGALVAAGLWRTARGRN